MRRFILSCIAITIAFVFQATVQPVAPALAAEIPAWRPLGVACLPHRAVKWRIGLPEEKQAPCHCPPIESCPDPKKFYENRADFFDGDARDAMNGKPMPPNMILRCCQMPVCPKGTTLAGWPLPEDGKCNIYCPPGSQLAGKLLPDDKDCNPFCPVGTKLAGKPYPADRNCNPVTLCPPGSKLAGKPVPPDGNCNPVTLCPPGSKLAGQPVPANGNCNPVTVCPPGSKLAGQPVPPDGNCNPAEVISCSGFTTQAVIGCEPGTSGDNCVPIIGTICCYHGFCSDSSCITANTKVTLADGRIKPAHKVEVGDVLAGPEGGSTVMSTNRYRTANRLLYSINNGALTVSGNHPILTSKGYTVVSEHDFPRFAGKEGYAAAHLQKGNIIIADKQTIVVEDIKTFYFREPVSTFNFITDGQKPFFAGGMALKPVKDIEFNY